MSLLLAIETATPVCSVALARDGECVAIRETTSANAHSSLLTIYIEQLFQEAGYRYQDLDAVAVSMGPGSYTGLRIGVAAAKGLCYALEKPLIAVPTLQAMAEGMNCQLPIANCPLLICPVIDARRMEVYCAVYNEQLEEIRPTDAVILHENSFQDLLSNHVMIFGGTGAQKCKPLLAGQPNAVFLDNFQASAGYLIPLAEKRFFTGHFENLAYFEPFYLKDFVAGKPKVKGLH
ncbi:MAG: tRNA (adenosine(37)-N6)-threonylcarbamoyltransferase complex dimerization subunit type 1 TsaB [bacterium]